MRVSIVIPSYTNTEGLKKTLQTIEQYTDVYDANVIVSLNGAPNASREVCAEYLPHNWFTLLDSPTALGYAGACNAGIKVARNEIIVLLNDDIELLPQKRNTWIEKLIAPFSDPKVGITGPLVGPSLAGLPFAIFFCVAIRKTLFEELGLLDEDFKEGAGEDSLFCHDASAKGYKIVQVPQEGKLPGSNGIAVGDFPIYHHGEATVAKLDDWQGKFDRNGRLLLKKCLERGYIKSIPEQLQDDFKLRHKLSNNCERAVISAVSEVPPRETTRYKWAREHIVGNKILEIGCSSGYGLRFLQDIPNLDYTGIDYDHDIIEYAKTQFPKHKFWQADINKFELGQYDTIICFECIEHVENGKEIAQRLKKHCKRLLLTVPHKEPVGFWGPWHKLHNLTERDFPNFDYTFIGERGELGPKPFPGAINLILMDWEEGKTYKQPKPYVLATVSTRERLFTTLPLVLQGIINQTTPPDRLIIYDDSKDHLDTRTMDPYPMLFQRLQERGINWEVRFTPQHGQVKNHEDARKQNADIVWRLDDDAIPEPQVLETLLYCLEGENTAAAGGLILTPGQFATKAAASGSIEDVETHLNYQWCPDLTEPVEVQHLHCSFAYKTKFSKPYPELSRVGHREETWFTHNMFQDGYRLVVDPKAITRHYRASKGGIRCETDAKLWADDEILFRAAHQNIKPPFWCVLNNAIGDHCVFARILPALKAKHPGRKFILAVCYPDLFKDEQVVSIAHAQLMLGDIERYNVYRYGDLNKSDNLEAAFRGVYGL